VTILPEEYDAHVVASKLVVLFH